MGPQRQYRAVVGTQAVAQCREQAGACLGTKWTLCLLPALVGEHLLPSGSQKATSLPCHTGIRGPPKPDDCGTFLTWSCFSCGASTVTVRLGYWRSLQNLLTTAQKPGKKATSLTMCACVGWCLVLFIKADRRQCPKLDQTHKGAFCPINQLQMTFLFWQGFYSECNPALHPAPGL